MRPHYYRLVGHDAVPCTMEEWAKSMFPHVGETAVGEMTVSTIFLGIDHSFMGEGPPILFETMISTGETAVVDLGNGAVEYAEFGEYQTRCSTYDEAEAMHREAVKVAQIWVARAGGALAALPRGTDTDGQAPGPSGEETTPGR